MNIIPVFLLVIALLAAAGCTSTQTNGGNQVTGTPAPQDGQQGGQSGVTGAGNLVTSPTDAIPGYNMVTVDVGEKDYLGTIPVIFQGGMGQIHVSKISATIYRSDGTQETAQIGIKKGDEVDFMGTKEPTALLCMYIWIMARPTRQMMFLFPTGPAANSLGE